MSNAVDNWDDPEFVKIITSVQSPDEIECPKCGIVKLKDCKVLSTSMTYSVTCKCGEQLGFECW
jgi:transcription elongation factor Elf1